jgi:excisionase family DNA binding protein
MAGSHETLAVSVAETARRLGLSRQGTYQAVQRGEIPSVRVGKRILVPRSALEQLLQVGPGVQGPKPDAGHKGSAGRR